VLTFRSNPFFYSLNYSLMSFTIKGGGSDFLSYVLLL
jgi:hypothetical protein